MNTFPQPGQQNFQQFAGGAPQPQTFPNQPPTQAQAPQPQTFPTQQGGFPQVNPLAQTQQPAGAAFGPGAFDQTTVTASQHPSAGPGSYEYEIVQTELKTYQGRTHVTDLKVIQSTNPSFPPGMVVSVVKPLDGNKWAFMYGASDVLQMTIAACGFKSETEFKTAVPAWSPLMNAMCDPKQQLAGNPWGPNPLAGRHVFAVVTASGAVIKRGRSAGAPIMTTVWSPYVPPAGAV